MTKLVNIKVVASNNIENSKIYWNEKEISEEYELKIGFNFFIKNRRCLMNQKFDLYTIDHVYEIEPFIHNLLTGTFVVCIAMGSDLRSLSDRELSALNSVGCYQITNGYRDANSFAMVGYKGLSMGSANESIASGSESTCSVSMQVSTKSNNEITMLENNILDVELFNHQNEFKMKLQWNGIELMDIDKVGTGLNIVIFNRELLIAEHRSFQTNKDDKESEFLVKFLNSVQSDQLVMMFNRGDITERISEEALHIIDAQFGSSYISEFKRAHSQGSWCMFTSKSRANALIENYLHGIAPLKMRYSPKPYSSEQSSTSISIGTCRQRYSAFENYYIIVNDSKLTKIPSDTNGFVLAVLDELTGLITYSKAFDLSKTTDIDEMTLYIDNSISVGSYVLLVSSKFDYSISTDQFKNLKDSVRSLGATRFHLVNQNLGYCLVGRKGASPGTVMESLEDGPCSIFTEVSPQVNYAKAFIEIRTQSCGNGKSSETLAGWARFQINGKPVTTDSKRGLNVLVMDQLSGNIVNFQVYDTWESESNSNRFAELIESLPQGRLVAIAVLDDAYQNLNNRARDAIKSLGSTMIDQLKSRDSYSIIGVKGGLKSQCTECHSPHSPTSCDKWFFIKDKETPIKGFEISIHSQGSENLGGNSKILINDSEVSMQYKPGLNVAYIDSQTLSTTTQSYETNTSLEEAQKFLKIVYSMPLGSLVLVSVHSNFGKVECKSTLYTALQMIGALKFHLLSTNGSYTLIGIRGASPGSALEHFDNSASASISSFIPMVPPSTNAPFILPVTLALAFAVTTYSIMLISISSRLPKSDNLPSIFHQPDSFSDSIPIKPRQPGQRVVRALFTGSHYKTWKNPIDPIEAQHSDSHENYIHHGGALVNNGYIQSDDIRIVDDHNTGYLIINDRPVKIGPSKTIISYYIKNWLTKDLLPGDTIYFSWSGHAYRHFPLNGEKPYPELQYTAFYTFNDDLDDITVGTALKGEDFQKLFADVPQGVNISISLGTCFAKGFIQSPVMNPIPPIRGQSISFCAVDENHYCKFVYKVPSVKYHSFIYEMTLELLEHHKSRTKKISYQKLFDKTVSTYMQRFPTSGIPYLVNLTNKDMKLLNFLDPLI
ncbi:hypothetical protein DLAC_11262 [Tieghemostelium lacteum]|uniref:ILEI/PANDER domain-containing protein n=1 Tax=Tieghemostelium lacteum TaxID=361077 RepID=A0A151Z3L8_TIELA|nr:hypothetical protein DLAC_11262 [Tieghemostelium lacteum]|eukprot:KYQ88538.1 hypothetical protein DLAC_11262 [Tieghemostelium lacteum]